MGTEDEAIPGCEYVLRKFRVHHSQVAQVYDVMISVNTHHTPPSSRVLMARGPKSQPPFNSVDVTYLHIMDTMPSDCPVFAHHNVLKNE
jgi:hypothetical protein